MRFQNGARLGALMAAGLCALLAAPQPARALTSVEGSLIGDQNFYWNVPGQAWIFPHTIGNIDNRVMLQLGQPSALRVVQNQLGNALEAGLDRPFQNQLDVQSAAGGGFVLELMDQFNVAMWVSAFSPGLADFVDRGITNTQWGAPGGDLAIPGVDPYTSRINGGAPFGSDPANRLSTGRKLDLFASYWLPDLGVEAGAHLWWGSASFHEKLDDSAGPIDIDVDSNPATGDAQGAEQELDIKESTYSLSDFGIGLGGAYTAIEGFRADLGLDLNMLGVNYEPNGIGNFLDAGGTGFAINARAHYDLTEKTTIGGFARFGLRNLSFKPKRQRDGGDLRAFFTNLSADQAASLPTPPAAFPSGDPALGADLVPVSGIEYNENSNELQVAALGRYTPISRVKLYGALGFRTQSLNADTHVGNAWIAEQTETFSTLPFVNLGFQGKVLDWLDLFLGAKKEWRGSRLEDHYFDSRIPNDQFGAGAPAGTVAPPAGNEANVNANRRDIKQYEKVDASVTQLLVGTRVHYGPMQLVGQLDPDLLTRGLYFLSGSAGPTWFWVSLIYDWDYDKDVESGNGTMVASEKPSPHEMEPAAPAPESEMAPAPAPLPAPEPAPEAAPEEGGFEG